MFRWGKIRFGLFDGTAHSFEYTALGIGQDADARLATRLRLARFIGAQTRLRKPQ